SMRSTAQRCSSKGWPPKTVPASRRRRRRSVAGVGGLDAGAVAGFASLVDLHEDFAAAHHAEIVAGAFLDRLAAFGEVAELRLEAGVVGGRARIDLLLLDELATEPPDLAPAPLAEPERVLDRHEERTEDEGQRSHRDDTSAGCRRRGDRDSWPRRRGLPRSAGAGCTSRCGRSGRSEERRVGEGGRAR